MSDKKNKLSRIAAGVGLTVGGVALAGAALYTEIMTSVIARRRSAGTDAIISMATGGSSGEPNPQLDAAVEAFRTSATEKVELRSHDQYVLRARWYPVAGATRILLCAHGWHSTWDVDFSGIGPALRELGCHLLLIEQRCHGESGGNLISYGIRERYDILTWLDWLEREHPGLPVYLCGVSMGAATVLMAAGLPIAGRVAGIIADCGYSDPKEIVKLTLQKSIGGMSGPTLAAVNLNCKIKDKFTFGDYSPIEAMAANTAIPCLFIHGDDDKLVPVRMSIENYYACQAPKELLIVPGAAHAMSFATAPETYKQKVADFFAAYDPPPAPTKRRRRKQKERGTA